MDNDLISRKALLKELKEWYNESKQREEANYEWETFESSGIESAMLCVEKLPAVDAEPVRHGWWILNPCNLYNDATWVCSVCGNERVLIDGISINIPEDKLKPIRLASMDVQMLVLPVRIGSERDEASRKFRNWHKQGERT